MTCLTCLSNSGEQRISPGPTVYEGAYWYLEHAYPTSLKGWLVAVLKRHVEALHELTPEEFAELGVIQARAMKLLFETLNCEKEYMMCLAESEGFHHIHVHIVPKPHDLPEALKATRIFALLKVTAEEALPPREVKAFCELLRERW
jgi:diadenosine tetraphosphate (Ap4A) HIT family hydrolase